jgi:tetratricopeptide (TPR) repeat protein
VTTTLLALVVLTLCISPTIARASSDDIILDREAAFRHALEHLEAGRLHEAIPILRRLNEAYPGGTGVLWNLGQATSKIGEHSEALTYWLAFRALEPDDWHVHSKLVQTHQALGDRLARDGEVLELLDNETGMHSCLEQNQASPGGTGGKRRHPRAHENTGIGADEPEA